MQTPLLTPGQTCRLLACDRKQLAKIRRARPDIAIRLPAMRNWRYLSAKLDEISRPKAAGNH